MPPRWALCCVLLHAASPRSEIRRRLEGVERPGTELAEPSVWGHDEQSAPSEKSIRGKFLFFFFLLHSLL